MSDWMNALRELNKLYNDGLLSKAEFEKERKKEIVKEN